MFLIEQDASGILIYCKINLHIVGTIDEVKIWNRTLTADEIKEEYDSIVNPIIRCYNNLDCGTPIQTNYCSNDSACTSSSTPICNNNGTTSSFCTLTGGGGCTFCAYGCEDGACKNCAPNCAGKTCGSDGCGGSCGDCIEGYTCNSIGECAETVYGANVKNMLKYSNKEAFLISDNNWKDILPLVPATTWTGSEDCQEGYGTPENVCVYPTLIYHEEGEGFDADSIIYFMQQYSPNKVTIIGNTPQELDDLLIAAPELGAGLQIEQLQRINSEDYLSYWQKFEEVIYVEDNYELALLASTYASLINAPLIIHGTSLDKIETFSGKEVICIGSGSPSGSSCSKQYDLRTLQQKYVEKVNEIDTEKLNKFIVVNSRDIDFVGAINYVPRDLITEKSGDTMHYLFKKDSLIAPILASAKHEVIIPLSAEIDVGQSSISTFNSTCDFHNLGCNNLKQQIKDNVEGLAPYVQEDYANIGEHHEDFDIALYSEGSEEILFETPDDSIEPTIYDNKIAWIEVNTTYLYDESRPSTNKWLNIEDYSISIMIQTPDCKRKYILPEVKDLRTC